jgi:4-amino-4-deoxy-L-arabinose transferase-like glycosyltransferase
MLPFALFMNLGLMPLISDEPTRGIVSLEMMLSGNYITPTINGEFYYNKPPLFNWILTAFMQLSGRQDEFILRLPTIISLLLMGLVIFLLSRKTLGKNLAILTSLMWITSTRILFWDSFQGLIDITYALVTLSSFTLLYHYSQKKRWMLMFITTYLLAAAGYLMKGLPSIAFQGISLLVWLIYEKNFRKLFSWQHLAGISTFVLITGAYYFAYLQSNSLNDVFATLFDQSNRINNKEGSLLSWAVHLLSFPLEMIYEFAPWTLLLLLLLNKKIRLATFDNKLTRFCLILFASNIIIYWVSADMRPRYLFMLFPLLYIMLMKAYAISFKMPSILISIVNVTLQILAFAGAFSLLIYLFWDETNRLPGVWVVIPLIFMVSITAALLTIKYRELRLWLLIIVMLGIRIGFNACNLPARYKSYPDASYRAGEILAGKMAKGTKTYILGDTPFNHDASFYISRESGQIITRTTEISNNQAFYITNEKNLANFADGLKAYEIVHTFTIKLNETKLFLIKKPV